MVEMKTKMLSLCSRDSLAQEIRVTEFPKWRTICLLRHLKLSVLDAMFIPPHASQETVAEAVYKFSNHLGKSHLMVRSDGGREMGGYYEGGNTFPVAEAVQRSYKLLRSGRAVILVEPTCRFTNLLSVNILISSPDIMTIELLGPGYDIADLNRGYLTPQVVISGSVDWISYTEPQRGDFHYQLFFEEEEDRRRRRLLRIGKKILPQIGVNVYGDPELFAKNWLIGHGYTHLWELWEPKIDIFMLRQWYAAAYRVAQELRGGLSEFLFTMSGSDLGDRFVWWDVVVPYHRFRM